MGARYLTKYVSIFVLSFVLKNSLKAQSNPQLSTSFVEARIDSMGRVTDPITTNFNSTYLSVQGNRYNCIFHLNKKGGVDSFVVGNYKFILHKSEISIVNEKSKFTENIAADLIKNLGYQTELLVTDTNFSIKNTVNSFRIEFNSGISISFTGYPDSNGISQPAIIDKIDNLNWYQYNLKKDRILQISQTVRTPNSMSPNYNQDTLLRRIEMCYIDLKMGHLKSLFWSNKHGQFKYIGRRRYKYLGVANHILSYSVSIL